MRRLLLFFTFAVCLIFGVFIARSGRYRDVFQSVCDLTEDHFYKSDSRLEDWLRKCHGQAARVSMFATVEELLAEIQALMNEMTVSHFQIYNPAEDRRLWKGEGIDTGVRARYVEDHLVVYRVFVDGAGAAADMRVGDEILKISGTDQVTPWGASHRSGEFTVKRGEKVLQVTLAAKTMVPDSSPKLSVVGPGTALVELPSFRSEFFEREAWRKFTLQFKPFNRLIVDVRENAGGNFVAMLRAVSSFQCGGKSVGLLVQPRKVAKNKLMFDDNTSDKYQIEELDRFRGLGLQTFYDYGCFSGNVTVLAGPDTSSVSEIFVHSFLNRPNSRVWGQPTAGDVVLAVWYDLPILGEGFSVSIPEAVFLTPDKKELEGQGVSPQRELYYNLKISLQGKDSWVEEAKR